MATKRPMSEKKRQSALANLQKAWEAQRVGKKPSGNPPPLALAELEPGTPAVRRQAAVFARLLEEDGTLGSRPVYGPLLETAASAYLQVKRLDGYLSRHGVVRRDGTVRPALEAYTRLLEQTRKLLEAAGMTPTSLQRLGLATARTAADTALALAKLRAERGDAAITVEAEATEPTGQGESLPTHQQPVTDSPPES